MTWYASKEDYNYYCPNCHTAYFMSDLLEYEEPIKEGYTTVLTYSEYCCKCGNEFKIEILDD